MENYGNMVRCGPYAPSVMHDVVQGSKIKKRHEWSNNNYYVFSSANQASPIYSQAVVYQVAPQIYNPGSFQIATEGNAVSTEIGELYVEYSFTMIHARAPGVSTGGQLNQLHLMEYPIGSGAAATPFGTTGGTGCITAPSTLTPTVGTNNFTYATAPTGNYMLCIVCNGSVTSIPTTTVGGNITKQACMGNYATTERSGVSSGNTVYFTEVTYGFGGSTVLNRITVSGLTGFTGGTMDLFMSQVTSAILFEEKMDLVDSIFRRLIGKYPKLLNLPSVEIDDKESEIDIITPPPSVLRKKGYF